MRALKKTWEGLVRGYIQECMVAIFYVTKSVWPQGKLYVSCVPTDPPFSTIKILCLGSEVSLDMHANLSAGRYVITCIILIYKLTYRAYQVVGLAQET